MKWVVMMVIATILMVGAVADTSINFLSKPLADTLYAPYGSTGGGGSLPNTQTCPAGDFFSAFSNVTSAFTCETPSGSVGGYTFAQYNITKIDVGSNFTASTGGIKEVLSIPLSANKNITIECAFAQHSAAAASGLIYNFTVTKTRILEVDYRMDYPTTAAATGTCPLTLALQRTILTNSNGDSYFPCIQTGTSQFPRDAKLNMRLTTNDTPGIFNVTFSAEVLTINNNANITRGSWCRSVEMSG